MKSGSAYQFSSKNSQWQQTMAECGDDVIFQSSLDINKKTHQVQLTRTHITWDVASPGKPSRQADSPSSQPFIGKYRGVFTNQMSTK